jgi:ABC-2 type transport system ATP-binding protein
MASGQPIIVARRLAKTFRTPRRHAGRLGWLRTLVTRQYDIVSATQDISFDIEPGELVGYIGPNGAGKSTTIKMLTGILVPSSGDVEVAGIVPWRRREANARNIGVVFGQRSQLWWDLPLVESFELVRRMYSIVGDRYRRNLDRFRDILDLDPFLSAPVRTLSLGQRMRGELTAALLHEPRVVFLDEPTVGLDVVAKERIREFIAEINRDREATVILTTHDLSDVERLCRRVILIDRGQVLFDGSVERLKREHARHRELVVRLADDNADRPVLAPIGAEVTERVPGVIRLKFDPEAIAAHHLIAEVAGRYAVRDLSIVEPALESIVRDLYEQRPARDR